MFQAPQVVEKVCTGWLGMVGGILAVFGVVAAPITSGDTAFRSARLIIAEALHVDQKKMSKRVAIALPIFAAAIALLYWQIENKDGFNTLWQWFGWSRPDAGCVYVVGHHRLSCTAKETVRHNAHSCHLHDHGLFNIPAHLSHGIPSGTDHKLHRLWYSLCCGNAVVRHLV